ncbi:uncharacterized protein LTR77_001883 [Saxophila tyrrhenica]|uniref:Uncharacterized protein n=1 Tax=Saxophila tyrrhenica TaxID=1690608 RepID=A0AAV9PMB0_9PEZI|nr:hypothetical protein LTR77_001883 [Saxophila tyrrhenica]
MSFYDNDAPWSASARQSSWEQPPPPSRSGTGSSMSQQAEPNAFAAQFEEIDRATDNLMRSGKFFPGAMQPMGGMPPRRDSIPAMQRGFEYGSNDPRMGGSGGPSRQASGSDYDGGRPGSAGLQGYYQGQRFPGGRQSEAEQMLQAKRRMAAQRERELRNYHQEQQYNRTVSGGKSDRSMSPNTMSEDDRRELIARQHRALYGDNASLYGSDGSNSRPQSQDVRASEPGRGGSPLAFSPYGAPPNNEGAVQMPPRDRGNSTASPVSSQPTQQPFNFLSDAQQNSRTSNSSPTESPPPGQQSQKGAPPPGVAPIGTRPSQAPTSAGGLNKRSTTPLTPSSLSYGFSADAQNAPSAAPGLKDERASSAASNGPQADKSMPGLGGWGGDRGAWGGGKGLAVQPGSVWG